MKQISSRFKKILMWIKKLGLVKQAVLALVIIGGIYLLYPKSSATTVTYQTEAVTKGSVTQVVSDTGEIISTANVAVNSTINGVIADLAVANGDTVERGQKLFTVTSSATPGDRVKAYASYISAKNTLESAKTTKYSLESSMWAANSAFIHDAVDQGKAETSTEYIQTNRDWLAAQQKYQSQDQVIAAAQSELSAAWYTYQATADGPVVAPIAGTVANVSVGPGQSVDAATPALLISTQQEVWAKVSVSESDVKLISPDQPVKVLIDSLNGQAFTGAVKRVDAIGTNTSGVISYNVYVLVTDTAPDIKQGMTAQIEITTQNKDNVLLVPNAAVKPYQGSKAVQIKSQTSGSAIYVPVETGIKGDTNTEIITGLTEGQEVIVSQSGGSTTTGSGTGGGFFGGAGR